MKMPRGIMYTAGGGLLVAWLAAAAGVHVPGTPPTQAAIDAASSAEPAIISVEAEANRLRAALMAPPRPRAASRNPFRFEERVPAKASHGRVPERPVPAPTIAAPPGPELKLVGIAEDEGEAPARTAIISAAGQLFLAREGEQVAERYRIVRIGADAVELQDVATGETIRIGLR